MGLAAVGHHRVLGPLTAGHLFTVSSRLGTAWRGLTESISHKNGGRVKASPFNILQP
jgi:hypothetical protein